MNEGAETRRERRNSAPESDPRELVKTAVDLVDMMMSLGKLERAGVIPASGR